MLRRRIVAFAAGAALAAIIAPALQAQHAQQLGPSALSMPAVPTATTSGVDESVKNAAAQAVHQATQQAAQQIAMSRMPAIVVPQGAPVRPRLSRAPITQAPAMQAPQMQAPAAPPVRTAPAQVAPTQPRTTSAPTVTATSKTPTTAASSVTTGATPVTGSANADAMLTKLAPQMDLRMGGGKNDNGLHLSGTVGIVVMMGLLTLLPTLLLLMTGFTRILIVLHFLRQALGTQNAPPAHLVAALALILTGFVMAPTLSKVNDTALQPWMDGKIEQGEMLKTAVVPFRDFMLKHTRDHDLQVFIDMSQGPQPKTEADIPLVTLVSAFATSELRTSFQIGFAIFLPFIIIDIVVSSVLMSMGMFMLPPAMISLPFKLLLFVLVDGWTLVVQSLVTSFRV